MDLHHGLHIFNISIKCPQTLSQTIALAIQLFICKIEVLYLNFYAINKPKSKKLFIISFILLQSCILKGHCFTPAGLTPIYTLTFTGLHFWLCQAFLMPAILCIPDVGFT